MNLAKISYGSKIPEEFNAIIEIPAYSHPVKYEMDKETGALFVDRFVGTGMSYPFNYGFIPQTLSEDGDPLDVLVITPFPLVHGAVINCRPVGVLRMEDELGIDVKILSLPTKKICQLYDKVSTVEDLPSLYVEQIKYFFEHYKGLENGKWVKIIGWDSANAAKQEIVDSIKRYSN